MPNELERVRSLASAEGGFNFPTGARCNNCQGFRGSWLHPLRNGGGSVVLRTALASVEGGGTLRKLVLARLRPLSLTGSVQLEARGGNLPTREIEPFRPVCMLSSAWFGLNFEREVRSPLVLQIVNSCLPLRQTVSGK